MMELKQLSKLSQISMRGKDAPGHLWALLTRSSVRTGEWVGDCFIYTNSTNRLNYLVGDQTYTISHFDQPMYLLGYIQRDSRIYLCDKDVNVTSFSLSLSVVEYQTLVLRDDMESAAELLPSIPADQLNKIARFLEGQGHKELALEVATDPEHKFELALALGHLPIALELAREADVEHKWKTVGDAALSGWDVALAAECFKNAKDLGSLLLLHSSTGDRDGLRALSVQAEDAGAHNVAFTCLWQLADVEGCIDLLTKTGRTAEAVLFSQTYKPSLTVKTVGLWKQSLEKEKKGRVAKTVGVPGEDEELFPEWEEYLKLENEGGVSLIDVNGDEAEEPVNGDAPDAEGIETEA
jgi:coatomer subunit beta'